MNQIPNIEEMSERFKKEFLAEGSECTWKDYPLATDVLDWVRLQEQTHHQQLQKARQTWLQEEIVRLDGMKTGAELRSGDYSEHRGIGFDKALQTIIDRYHSELDQAPEKLPKAPESELDQDNLTN